MLRRLGQTVLSSGLLAEASGAAPRAFATGSVEFKVGTQEAISKLQALVRKFEDQNAARNVQQWEADLKAGKRSKEQHEHFVQFRQRLEAEKKEADAVGLDPLAYSAMKNMERWQEFEAQVQKVPIPWDKLDDLAEIEAYVKKAEAIRKQLGLLSRAEEFAAVSEVARRASGGSVRKYRALLEGQVALPDNLAYNAALDQAEAELKKTLVFEDKEGMAKFESIRKQIYAELKTPYDADPLAAGVKEQVLQVQAELKSRKEFRDAALQRVVADLEEDSYAAA